MITYGGKEKYFGSNPYSFACPNKKNEPYCLDMATTIMPWNRLLIARNNNSKPDGFFAADKNGKKTDNPQKLVVLFQSLSNQNYCKFF